MHILLVVLDLLGTFVFAIAWYLRLGYLRIGEHALFPYGKERFGISRRDDLRFEWLVEDLVDFIDVPA